MLSVLLLFLICLAELEQDKNGRQNLPPYYNIKDTNSQNPKTAQDGGLVSSEGYSYVTEVPSLPSSHQRHSNSSSKKADYYNISAANQASEPSSNSNNQHSRQRRTQRKITHNEKRYHSGMCPNQMALHKQS